MESVKSEMEFERRGPLLLPRFASREEENPGEREGQLAAQAIDCSLCLKSCTILDLPTNLEEFQAAWKSC